MRIRFYLPDAHQVEDLIARHRPGGFKQGVEERKSCCQVRKVDPLTRALSDRNAWITGLRRGQSAQRADVERQTWDAFHEVEKFAPLAHWTKQQVWDFVRKHDVPHHPLYDLGYASIGCAPCTRAITVGEDERAGRWWWEDDAEDKECGLHAPIGERPIEWTI